MNDIRAPLISLIFALLVSLSLQNTCQSGKTQNGPSASPSANRESSVTTRESEGAKAVTKLQTGIWGGPHISMEVKDASVQIEFDCAHAAIDRGIELSSEGRFDVRGTYTPEGGPVSSGDLPKDMPARFRGQVTGKNMTLTVTLIEGDNTFEPYSLTHGKETRLEKCY